MNSTIKPKPCPICSSKWHSKMFHNKRKPLAVRTVPKRTKRPKQQSDKEKDYQVWKETVARPALIERDGNYCACCHRPAREGEKLDIEHTLGKGAHPDLKRDLNNLTLMCRYPCHNRKTDGKACVH